MKVKSRRLGTCGMLGKDDKCIKSFEWKVYREGTTCKTKAQN